MYVVIRKYQVDPQSIDEATRQVREGFVPIVSAVAGFQGYYWLKAEDGAMLSVGIFDDKAGADASVHAAKDFVAAHLAQHLPYPPQVTEGEVLVHQAD